MNSSTSNLRGLAVVMLLQLPLCSPSRRPSPAQQTSRRRRNTHPRRSLHCASTFRTRTTQFDAYTRDPCTQAESRELPAGRCADHNGVLELVLKNAIALALENNLDIAIARYNIPIAASRHPPHPGRRILPRRQYRRRAEHTGRRRRWLRFGGSGAGAGGTSGGAGGAGSGASGLVAVDARHRNQCLLLRSRRSNGARSTSSTTPSHCRTSRSTELQRCNRTRPTEISAIRRPFLPALVLRDLRQQPRHHKQS